MARKAVAATRGTRRAHTPSVAASRGVAKSAPAPTNRGMPHPLARGGAMDAQMIEFNDTLSNLVTGMGTDRDKAQHTFFGYALMGREQLDAAYRGDWIARKAIDITPDDATREWRNWQAEPEQITALENEEKRLRLQKKVKTAMQWARLYGGAALILGVDGAGQPHEELDWTKVKKDALKWVHVVTKFDLTFDGQFEEDLNSPYFDEPKMWTRVLKSGGRVDIHPSRIIKFVGMPNPDTSMKDPWGDSVLQVIGDAIVGAGTTTSSIAQLVAEAKIDIVKIPGMSEKMVNLTYQQNLKARFGNAAMMKSLYNTLLVDAAEEWERLNQSFQSLDDILKMYLLIACAAVDVPATRFLSQSPQGLSATGESDLRNYYDKCSTEQNNEVTPTIEPLDNVLIMSCLGNRPDEIWYEWNPLWQLTPAEQADIAVKKSQVMTADVNAALFPPGMLYQMRLNQLTEDGTYPGIEQIEDEFGDDIDERQAQEQEAEAERMMQELQNAQAANENDPAGNATATDPRVAAKAPKQLKAANDGATVLLQSMADRIAGRVRTSMADASSPPRSLYIHRDVVNKDELKAWAKSVGFKSSLDDMHVTILYSKGAVDWLKVGSEEWGENDKGQIVVKAGGPRVMQLFGDPNDPRKGAIVLTFANSSLQYRHESIMRNIEGATYDHDEYTPHVTITYRGLPEGVSRVEDIEPYQGQIVFGPELFQAVTGNWNSDTVKES